MKDMKKIISITLALVIVLSLCCCSQSSVLSTDGESWKLGFASREIEIPDSESPLYIAGYKNGKEITGVRDLPCASAVWIECGGESMILMGIDCVALSSDTVGEIRSRLGDFCRDTKCGPVNVFATHTHESVDTLGLWGPVGFDGKNEDFQKNLIDAAVEAAGEAYANAKEGRLYYSDVQTEDLLEDSRDPQVYDDRLHQLRFVPSDSPDGIRMIFLAAHAESMRSGNTLVSRDFPGVLSDTVKEECGDSVLFIPGAIGGLIMTKELCTGGFDAEENVTLTGEKIASYALSIKEEDEREIAPKLKFARIGLDIPLDNTLFMYYKFLGVLGSNIKRGSGETGYSIASELGMLMFDDIALCLMPGEIFPELVYGTAKDGYPEVLCDIASRYGISNLLICGLCNDEIGYIVPPSDYLLNEKLPYVDGIEDSKGENHYEETNSASVNAAKAIAEGFEKLCKTIG